MGGRTSSPRSAKAHEYQTYDAAYVETILLQERRRRELPSPTQVRPRRIELIEETDLEEPDPAAYDRFCDLEERIQTMSDRHKQLHELLVQNLTELKLTQIAEIYREVLDEAARKNSSMLEVLVDADRRGDHRAAGSGLCSGGSGKPSYPNRKPGGLQLRRSPNAFPNRKSCGYSTVEFVEQRQCAVLIGPTGIGKTHILTALAYTACEKGLSVRFTRVIDMINTLTTAQINGTLERALKHYVHPSLLLLDELGYLPIDKRGADLMFQVVAARYESGSIVITTNRPFRDWGKIFDVDNTLATAMIDRLMHHGEAIVIQGDSYRTKDQQEPE